MSIIENLTLKQLSEETVMLPKLAHFASRALVDTYDEFINPHSARNGMVK